MLALKSVPFDLDKAENYLLFKDENRVLMNMADVFYRYLIKENFVLENEGLYATIQPCFQCISLPEWEKMIVVDREGIACLGWEGVQWKQCFHWAKEGCLKFILAEKKEIKAEYKNKSNGKLLSISFDMDTGRRLHHHLIKQDW